MDKEKLKIFIRELKELEKKHGIHISSSYEEEIDYDYEETSYVSGVNSYLLLVDTDGNETIYDENLLRELGYTCLFCGKEIEENTEFCNDECKKIYKGLR